MKHENLQGIVETNEQLLEFKDPTTNTNGAASTEDYYQDFGIRKAVVLVRYTDFMKGILFICFDKESYGINTNMLI